MLSTLTRRVTFAIADLVDGSDESGADDAGPGVDIGSVGVDLDIAACGLLGFEPLPIVAWLWVRRRRFASSRGRSGQK